MKLWTSCLCLLFLATGALGNDTLALSPEGQAGRELRVVPDSAPQKSNSGNEKLERLAAAFRDIKKEGQSKRSKRLRGNRKLIPAADMGFSLGQGIGKAVNWLPSKLRIPLAHNPQEETSLGLGLATLGYGFLAGKSRTKRFEQMQLALQQKYKMNGIYLASLEDENIEIRYCNKRLQKTLDKSTRHRKDMLAKLHLSITPN